MLSFAWKPLLLSFLFLSATSRPATALDCSNKNGSYSGDSSTNCINQTPSGPLPQIYLHSSADGGRLTISGSQTVVTTKGGITIAAQGFVNGNATGAHVDPSKIVIDQGSLVDVQGGGITLEGGKDHDWSNASPGEHWGNGEADLQITGGAKLQIDGNQSIVIGKGSKTGPEAKDTITIDKNSKLIINGGITSVSGVGAMDIEDSEIHFNKLGSAITFANSSQNTFKNITIADNSSNSLFAGTISSAQKYTDDAEGGAHITIYGGTLSNGIDTEGKVYLDPTSSIQSGGRLHIADGSLLWIQNRAKNTISSLTGSGILSFTTSGASLEINGQIASSDNFSGTIRANGNALKFGDNSKAKLSGATLNQANIVIGNGAQVEADSGTISLNAPVADSSLGSGPGSITVNGGVFNINNATLLVGNTETLKKGDVSLANSTLKFAPSTNPNDRRNPSSGFALNTGSSIKFDQSAIHLDNAAVPNGKDQVEVKITGEITGGNLGVGSGGMCANGSCIGNTYDHLSIYNSNITGESLDVATGNLFISPDSIINTGTLTVNGGIQLQSWESQPGRGPTNPDKKWVTQTAGHLEGGGLIQMGETVILDITGNSPVDTKNHDDDKAYTFFSGTIMGSGGDRFKQIVNFNDQTTLSEARLEALNEVNFYHDQTTITKSSALLGNNTIRFQGAKTSIDDTKIGTYSNDDSKAPSSFTPIQSGIIWAGYRDIPTDGSAYSSYGDLKVSRESSIQTEEFFIGRTYLDSKGLSDGESPPGETVELTGAGVTASLGQLVVGQAANQRGTINAGTLNITSGAKVSVDDATKYTKTKTPGIYVGNNSGSGLDGRTGSEAGDANGTIMVTGGSSLSLKDGDMYVGSNKETGYGKVTIQGKDSQGKKGSSLSLDKSTLNVGNTGAVYVSAGGVLNANGSSISLGDIQAAPSFDDTKSDNTPPKFDNNLTAGDINIDNGTLNVTGSAGAAKFSGEHTGNLEIHNHSTINVGTKKEAGSLNVDGNMIIDDDTVSHFYEGDAKPCPTDKTHSCSHGPSKETNPTDDSVIHVSGNLHIGGALNISGTGDHPDQFDEGLYTIYTYGKDLSGTFSDLNIASGDYVATYYTDHKGEVDVLIWNKNDAPPTVIHGGDITWDKTPKNGDGSVVIDGSDDKGNPKNTNITIDGGKTATTPNIIIHSGGTTIKGGSIAGKPSTSTDGDTSKDDAPVHINVNGGDNASGEISSGIDDPTTKNSDGKTTPAGHTSIKKDGDGDLVIDGGKKDYTGGTDVAGGTLDIGKKDPKNPNDSADITNSSGTTVDNGGTVNVNTDSKAGDITVNGGGTANIDGQTSHIDNKGGTTNINGDNKADTKSKDPNNPDKNTISNSDGGTVNINAGGTTGDIDSKDSNTNVNKGGTAGKIDSDGGSVKVDGKTDDIHAKNGGTVDVGGDGTTGTVNVDGKGGNANIDGQTGTANPDPGKPGSGGDVVADNGASISGSGTIHGDATVNPGGTIHAGSTTNPDKKDGDLNIDGDLNMGGNTTIDGSSGGTINVDGNTKIEDGPVHVHVHVDGNNGCSEAGKSCEKNVIHSDGEITGGKNLTPDDVNSGPLVKRKVVIGDHDIGVISTIPTYVVPGTNSGTGSGLDDLSHNGSAAAHSILDPLGNIDTVAGLKKAYSALSGEINADARTAMIDDGYMLQEAVIQRLDCMNDDLRRKALGKKGIKNNYCTVDPKHHFTVWGRMFGTRGDSFGSGQATMTQSSAGWIVGSDAQIAGTWRVGGILSYGRDWFGAHELQSTGHSDDVSLGMYAGNSWNMNNGLFDAALVLKMGAIYTWNIMHTHRTVSFQGYNGSLSADTLGSTFQGFSELGYKMLFNKHHKTPIEVEPFARLSFINFDTDNYAEHGSTAALKVHGEGTTVGYVDLGVKVASSIPINDGSYFSPHAALSYRGAFGNTNPRVHEEFAAANSGNYDMTINGVPISANTADLNIGFTVHVDDKIDFDMDYIGQYGSHITSSGGMGTFRYRF